MLIIRLIVVDMYDINHDRDADHRNADAGSPGAPALIGRCEVADPILAGHNPLLEKSDRGLREIPIASVIRVIRGILCREPELFRNRADLRIVRCNLRDTALQIPNHLQELSPHFRSSGSGDSRRTESLS